MVLPDKRYWYLYCTVEPDPNLGLLQHAKALNFEQQTSSYNLLAQVYKQLTHLPGEWFTPGSSWIQGHRLPTSNYYLHQTIPHLLPFVKLIIPWLLFPGWLDAVQALITLHPMNPDLWVQLAEVYKQCMNSPTCTECTLASHQAVPHRAQVLEDSDSSPKLASGSTEPSDTSNAFGFSPETEPEDTRSQSTCDVCTELQSDCKGHDLQSHAEEFTSMLNDLQIEDSEDTITRCQKKTCSTGMDLSLVIATCFLRARWVRFLNVNWFTLVWPWPDYDVTST